MTTSIDNRAALVRRVQDAFAGCIDYETEQTIVNLILVDRAAHDAQVRAGWKAVADSADGVIRAVLDALGVGYDHDPVLAARDAASVRDRFNEWLDEHDAQVAEKAWDDAVAMCCQMLGARNVNWPNPHRARAAEVGESERCPDCGRGDGGCDREASPDA